MTSQLAVARFYDAAQRAKKSLMPRGRKCYIVLRAAAFFRKDSL